jgi:hypothetical protein
MAMVISNVIILMCRLIYVSSAQYVIDVYGLFSLLRGAGDVISL